MIIRFIFIFSALLLTTVGVLLTTPADTQHSYTQPVEKAPIATTSPLATTQPATQATNTSIEIKKPETTQFVPSTNQKTAVQHSTKVPHAQTIITPTPSSTAAHSKQVNEFVRSAVVNILCSATNQTLKSISGSGVIIDPSGIILTNAHIGQYFLLNDYPTKGSISCSIRTGSPAYPRFKAELLYISPSWIIKNASLITQTNPTGTGEFDFALLRITETFNGSPLPIFPFLIPQKEQVAELGESLFVAGYPASFLGSIGVERDLYLLSAQSTIADIFTFGTENTVDLISIGGTVLSQKGASGGAVANQNGNLVGIVVTTTEGASTGERDLRAITTGHINRTLQKEIQTSLDALLGVDLIGTAQNFNERVAPALRTLLVQAIEQR